MDFGLVSLSDAFTHADYIEANRHFDTFAVILATPKHKKVFPELLNYFYDIHFATSDVMLVISPYLFIDGLNRKEVAQALATRRFPSSILWNFPDGEAGLQKAIDEYLLRQTEEVYRFCEFILGLGLHPRTPALRKDQLPCIAFFDDLERPENYLLWSLKGAAAEAVAEDFTRIVSALEQWREAKRNGSQMLRLRNWTEQVLELEIGALGPLDVIRNLDRARFALKALRWAGKLAPTLTKIVTPHPVV